MLVWLVDAYGQDGRAVLGQHMEMQGNDAKNLSIETSAVPTVAPKSDATFKDMAGLLDRSMRTTHQPLDLASSPAPAWT